MSVPMIIVGPGASLLKFSVKAWGVEARCPGCQRVQHFLANSSGTVRRVAFVHADDCPVHAQLQQAAERYERALVQTD